jgi:hypothetical protein
LITLVAEGEGVIYGNSPATHPLQVMHRLRSKSAVFRFRLAALLLCFKCAVWPLAGGVLAYSLVVSNHNLIVIAIGLIAVGTLVTIMQWMIAERTNCPLCITPILANKACSKSRHARKFFGSHRLYAAVSILILNRFRCPYCNEPTSVQARNRRSQSTYSKS